MRRPGPLQELPLEQFLSNLPTPSSSRPTKRPLSPGGPYLFSPAKRRILNEEGIFTPKTALKSPISRSALNTPARFADVLCGPESPAKILDFGMPKGSSGSPTKLPMPSRPVTRSMTKFAASPQLNPISRSAQIQFYEDEEMDDYFASPSSSMPRLFKPSTPVRATPPPYIDTQTIHYPGFRVYCEANSVPSSPSETSMLCHEDDGDKDGFKENIAPRSRRLKKATSPHPELVSQSPKLDGKSKGTEKPSSKVKSTPKKIFGVDKQQSAGTPTPRRSSRGPQSEGAATPKAGAKGRRSLERLPREVQRGSALNAA